MKPFLSFCFFLLSLTTLSAQDKSRGITPDEFSAAKKLTVQNLDKDTYVRTNDFVLDRDDEKPPYTFNFSDGVQRRIYLYKLFSAANMQKLGTLVVYSAPQNGQTRTICIPNSQAEKAVWGQYIDDLKDADKAANGFAACLAFALSREGVGELAGAQTGTAKNDDNEFCFPGYTLIRLADGSQKPISDIRVGDQLAGLVANEIVAVQVHKAKVATYQVFIEPQNAIFASTAPLRPIVTLEATPNHPILTASGRKRIDALAVNDIVFYYNSLTNSYAPARVAALWPNNQTQTKTYNLITKQGVYEVDGILVHDK